MTGDINKLDDSICFIQKHNNNSRGDHRQHINQDQSRNQHNMSNHHNQNNSDGLCHFHRRFGDTAFRCEQPCTWNSPPKQISTNVSSNQRINNINYPADFVARINTVFPKDYEHNINRVTVTSNTLSKPCFYHGRFGPRAKKCAKPCTWSNTLKRVRPTAQAGLAPGSLKMTARPQDSPTAVTAVAAIGRESTTITEQQHQFKQPSRHESYAKAVLTTLNSAPNQNPNTVINWTQEEAEEAEEDQREQEYTQQVHLAMYNSMKRR